MRPLERMMEERKRKQADSKEQQRQDWTPDEVEITVEKPGVQPLNAAPGVFAEQLERRFGGLNTAPSVFDRTAVFRTRKEDGGET